MSNDSLNMTDEEFLNSTPPEALEEATEASEEVSTTEVEASNESVSEEPVEALDSEEDNSDNLQEQQETSEVDYRGAYERLMQPIKANGKELQLTGIEDAIQLIQMGANYNKKMAAIKPHLKVVKALEKAGVNEETLNYLLDIHNKKPEAIQKLLKDSGIDPLDVDVSKEVDYRPSVYTATDKEIQLDEVLDDIKETPTFSRTIDILGNKWDTKSKQVLVDQPEVIKIINSHVDNGIYDQIMNVVERERLLGRLSGLSDIEAYKTVGDALNARGVFQQTLSKDSQPNVKVTNNDIAARKKAASSTKSKATIKEDFNPLSMSDEEFEKFANSKFV